MIREYSDGDHIADYASIRLRKNDDRQDEEKLKSDAQLRGKIGINQANKVIELIDKLKSQR